MAISDPLTHKIIGCAMAVHNELGNGFQEVIYQRALAIELEEAGVSFLRAISRKVSIILPLILWKSVCITAILRLFTMSCNSPAMHLKTLRAGYCRIILFGNIRQEAETAG